MASVPEQLEILGRGVEAIVPKDEFVKKLERSVATGVPLRVKYGIDPTGIDVHLGHTVPLRKLRQFQDLGHTAVIIIGNYTALVGDPSGRDETRAKLTEAQVQANAKDYLKQVGRIIDLDRAEVHHNGDWFSTWSFLDVLDLTRQMTIGQMMAREDFAKRIEAEKPVYLHECLYPLMQGWDSVEIRADVELGGTEQLFSLLVARDLQQSEGQAPQVALTMPILVGTDGTRRMGKSLGNYIGVAEDPVTQFAKVMSIPDEPMRQYFTLLTDLPLTEADRLLSPDVNPRDAKEALGKAIVVAVRRARGGRARGGGVPASIQRRGPGRRPRGVDRSRSARRRGPDGGAAAASCAGPANKHLERPARRRGGRVQLRAGSGRDERPQGHDPGLGRADRAARQAEDCAGPARELISCRVGSVHYSHEGGATMTTAVAPAPSPASQPSAPEPTASASSRVYRFSVAQYEKMINAGVLTKQDKVELIEGLLVKKMTKNSHHLTTTWQIDRHLGARMPEGWITVTEWPILLARSEPEPDVMLLRGSIADYADRKPGPGQVALLVEVADSSLDDDRARAPLFAEAGIPTYWIANIPDRRIEVYSDPAGAEYRSRQDFGLDAEVPLILDGQTVARLLVRDLLPPREQG